MTSKALGNRKNKSCCEKASGCVCLYKQCEVRFQARMIVEPGTTATSQKKGDATVGEENETGIPNFVLHHRLHPSQASVLGRIAAALPVSTDSFDAHFSYDHCTRHKMQWHKTASQLPDSVLVSDGTAGTSLLCSMGSRLSAG